MKYKGKGRIVLCFLLCMLMALPVGIGSAAAVKAAEQQTIIIGTNAEYSPFEYLDDTEISLVLIMIFWRPLPEKKT